MNDELVHFLAPLTPFTEATVEWTIGTLHLACYLTESVPPPRYLMSARAVVTDGQSVVVVEDPEKKYVLPGGRLEKGETPEDAMRREVLEETGWSITSFRQIGILHYRHLKPKRADWSHPHPDFLQIVYAATPGDYKPELREVGGYELGAEFIPVPEARKLSLDPWERVFLDEAVGCVSSHLTLGRLPSTDSTPPSSVDGQVSV